jgi:hypothetical protein
LLTNFYCYFLAAQHYETIGDSSLRAMAFLNKSKDRSRVILSSSSDTQPEALLPSNVNAESFLQLLLSRRNSTPSITPGFLNLAPRTDEGPSRGIEREENLQRSVLRTSPVSSLSNGTLTLEQQLASLNEELQRRHNSKLQVASLIIQQQSRHQGSSQAMKSVLDRMPTFDQKLPSLPHDEQLHQRSPHQVPREQNRVAFSIEEQLASLIKQQQVNRASFQDKRPTFEQKLASSNGPVSTSPACRLPSTTLLVEHQHQHQTSHSVSSLEKLQHLAQFQRDIVPQAQQAKPPEIQVQASTKGYYASGNVECQTPVVPATPYGSNEPFPEKLYRLLVDAERNGNDSIISFTPDGCSFKIHRRELFIQTVSPTYFRQAKVTAFVRQLNFYGFEKVLEGPNRGGFEHPYFRRGYPELLFKIERKLVAARPKKKCRGQGRGRSQRK